MNKNNKGFMLIEVIITSTVVLTVLIGLYTSFSKTYNNYLTKNTYYNLDASYATKEIVTQAIASNTFSKFINENLEQNQYGYFIKNGQCNSEQITILDCKNIQKFYNINNVIVLENHLTSFNTLKSGETNLNQTFYDYIDYLINYYELKKEKGPYKYIVLTEITDKEYYYYAATRVR